MSNKLIEVPETIKLLERAIEEKGADYRYPQDASSFCTYRDEDFPTKPSCIVGHVASYLGILDQLGEMTAADHQSCLERRFDEGSLRLLRNVQIHQDGGCTWGDAVAWGKETVL